MRINIEHKGSFVRSVIQNSKPVNPAKAAKPAPGFSKREVSMSVEFETYK